MLVVKCDFFFLNITQVETLVELVEYLHSCRYAVENSRSHFQDSIFAECVPYGPCCRCFICIARPCLVKICKLHIFICVFWQDFCLFLIHCACLRWLWFLEMRFNVSYTYCMWKIYFTFCLCQYCLCFSGTYRTISDSCWCVTLFFSTENSCAKMLFIILILENKSHPKQDFVFRS